MMKRASSTDRMSGRIAICAVFLFVHGSLFGQSLPALGGKHQGHYGASDWARGEILLPAVDIVGQPLRKMSLQAALARYQVPGASKALFRVSRLKNSHTLGAFSFFNDGSFA
jgi:hypothetical protein